MGRKELHTRIGGLAEKIAYLNKTVREQEFFDGVEYDLFQGYLRELTQSITDLEQYKTDIAESPGAPSQMREEKQDNDFPPPSYFGESLPSAHKEASTETDRANVQPREAVHQAEPETEETLPEIAAEQLAETENKVFVEKMDTDDYRKDEPATIHDLKDKVIDEPEAQQTLEKNDEPEKELPSSIRELLARKSRQATETAAEAQTTEGAGDVLTGEPEINEKQEQDYLQKIKLLKDKARAEEKPSLHERFRSDEPELSQKIKRPAANLKDLIDLNDRFLFIKELFKGNAEEYRTTIERLNNMHTGAEARAFLNSELRERNSWKEHPEIAEKFNEIVSKKF